MGQRIKWILAAGLSAMASSIFAGDTVGLQNNDPYEQFNRAVFRFNEGVDGCLLKPLARFYSVVTPSPVSKCISHFFSNIDTIPTVLNDVLQGNIYQATSDMWRLVINTTVGLVGLFDPASNMGLEPNSEDFGLTLARWGFKNSNYLVIPFLGPGTVRDQLAWPINYQFLTVYSRINPWEARYEFYLAGTIVKRAEILRYENVLEKAALDRYTFVRDAYMQHRNYQIQRNEELADPYLVVKN